MSGFGQKTSAVERAVAGLQECITPPALPYCAWWALSGSGHPL